MIRSRRKEWKEFFEFCDDLINGSMESDMELFRPERKRRFCDELVETVAFPRHSFRGSIGEEVFEDNESDNSFGEGRSIANRAVGAASEAVVHLRIASHEKMARTTETRDEDVGGNALGFLSSRRSTTRGVVERSTRTFARRGGGWLRVHDVIYNERIDSSNSGERGKTDNTRKGMWGV